MLNHLRGVLRRWRARRRLRSFYALVDEAERRRRELRRVSASRLTRRFRKLYMIADVSERRRWRGVTKDLVLALSTAHEAMRRALGNELERDLLVAAVGLLRGAQMVLPRNSDTALPAALALACAATVGQAHLLGASEAVVRRDHQRLAPFFALLGLDCVLVDEGQTTALARLAGAKVLYGTWAAVAQHCLRADLSLDHHSCLRGGWAVLDHGHLAAAGPDTAALVAPIDREPVSLTGADAAIRACGLTEGRDFRCDGVLPREGSAVPMTRGTRAETLSARLTPEGMERLASELGLVPLTAPAHRRCLPILERCLTAHVCYERGKHYFTGSDSPLPRLQAPMNTGEPWPEGLRPYLAQKEGLATEWPESREMAALTLTELLRRYPNVGVLTTRPTPLAPLPGLPHAAPHEVKSLGSRRVQRADADRQLLAETNAPVFHGPRWDRRLSSVPLLELRSDFVSCPCLLDHEALSGPERSESENNQLLALAEVVRPQIRQIMARLMPGNTATPYREHTLPHQDVGMPSEGARRAIEAHFGAALHGVALILHARYAGNLVALADQLSLSLRRQRQRVIAFARFTHPCFDPPTPAQHIRPWIPPRYWQKPPGVPSDEDLDELERALHQREAELGVLPFLKLAREVFLETIDSLLAEHRHEAQRLERRQEPFDVRLFMPELMYRLRADALGQLLRCAPG